jgi:hypothetical protein
MVSNPPINDRFDRLADVFSRSLIPVALLVFAAPLVAMIFYSSMNVDDYQYATNACPVPTFTRNLLQCIWQAVENIPSFILMTTQ